MSADDISQDTTVTDVSRSGILDESSGPVVKDISNDTDTPLDIGNPDET